MKRPRMFFCIVAGITAFNWIGWPFKVRFTHTALNYWFVVLLCMAIPLSIWCSSRTYEGKAMRVAGGFLSIFFALFTGSFGFLAAIEAIDIHKRGYDASFEYLKEVASSPFKYRLYRTNGGATTAFGLELRRELETPFGLKFVQPLWSKYREDNGELEMVSDKEIQVKDGGVLIASVKI